MKKLLPFFLILLAVTACNAPEMPLPGVTGKAGELVVVMDEALWKGPAGDTVFSILTKDVYGLPQPEPTFNVVHIKSSAFTKIFQTHRNIVYLNVKEGLKNTIELKTDVWASPQVVIDISASSIDELNKIIGANANNIVGHVLNKEQSRILRSYNAQLNKTVAKDLQAKWGLKMSVPDGYNSISEEENFSWLRYENIDINQNILVYSEPYEKQNTFSKEGMTEVLNKLGKAHIPGPDERTYMSIYPDYPPKFEASSIGDNYAAKLVGLWNVEGALMGGSFVCYAFLDATGTRVIYLYGFVFAPGKNKRNYVRQVDAILNSTELN